MMGVDGGLHLVWGSPLIGDFVGTFYSIKPYIFCDKIIPYSIDKTYYLLFTNI